MVQYIRRLAWSVILWGSGALPANAAIMADFDLGPATVTPTQASFDVTLSFAGNAGDQIEAYQLSILGSSSLLTAGGTDFSRFSYTPANSPAPLDAWTTSGTISITGTELGFPTDPVAGPFITPAVTPIVLGTLIVNLTGIAPGTALNVTLAGGVPGLETDVGGTFDGVFVPSVAAAGDPGLQLTFSDPGGVSFATSAPPPGGAIPEMTSLFTWGGLLALAGSFCGRRRGLPNVVAA
jgi:hypothetical protein